MRLLTGTVSLNESVETTCVIHKYLETSNQEGGGEGARIQKDSLKRRASDLQ